MVRIALAGTGGMADYQAKKFSRINNCILTVCKDHKPEQGSEFAAKHGMARCFDDIETLLDSGLCDALSCAVLDGRNRGICEPAILRGFPVLCEKPLARSLADCKAMASSAASSGIPNMVNFSKHNAPALSLLREIVKKGILGHQS
jgi:predicted dehydrogenase